VDPCAEWTVWNPAGPDGVTRMRDELPRALADTSLRVRLEAAAAITVYNSLT